VRALIQARFFRDIVTDIRDAHALHRMFSAPPTRHTAVLVIPCRYERVTKGAVHRRCTYLRELASAIDQHARSPFQLATHLINAASTYRGKCTQNISVSSCGTAPHPTLSLYLNHLHRQKQVITAAGGCKGLGWLRFSCLRDGVLSEMITSTCRWCCRLITPPCKPGRHSRPKAGLSPVRVCEGWDLLEWSIAVIGLSHTNYYDTLPPTAL
jgi:hypothetical protein